ncbi:hypothetical protein MLD38_023075 [Melastoma candidum]|uniref:Uncharacterized protein n=1 Tax=Melastoma candidum TaxID=119954 RepID=A0ACB9QQA7_9MYRT|nr:hypothetical protein MLD38_023075 [Melastoma candidum]
MDSGGQGSIGSGVQNVVEYLQRMQGERGFYYAIQSAGSTSCGNIFWADESARFNYACFADTVVFDTTYKGSGYRVPFASFSGLNHHGQPVLFGSAVILDESESSLVWLLQTWLDAMSGRVPVSITTAPDGLIQTAVARVFPSTRHRFSKSVIFRETQDKLADICQLHPALEDEFRSCVDECATADEFESCWASLLDRYYVADNEWLKTVYNAREQWVPLYLRNTFFGDLGLNAITEGLNAFFEGYVDESTSFPALVKQYEMAVASWHEMELKADYETKNSTPVLKTPSPMERQAAGLFTRRIFLRFQEELVETLANPVMKIDELGSCTTYRVAKFGEEHKTCTVKFDSFEMKSSCSCRMFEYSGLVCRHILAAFRANNVLTLPLHYVLKRWTQDAKMGTMTMGRETEVSYAPGESLTSRCNNLRQRAIKFAEEGAKSIQIYNVAMEALQEAAKKVAAAKNIRCRGSAETGPLVNGGSEDLRAQTEDLLPQSPTVASTVRDEKEKQMQELTAELESTNRRCEVYRTNLLAILKDYEEQKLKLSVKMQNTRLRLKE